MTMMTMLCPAKPMKVSKDKAYGFIPCLCSRCKICLLCTAVLGRASRSALLVGRGGSHAVRGGHEAVCPRTDYVSKWKAIADLYLDVAAMARVVAFVCDGCDTRLEGLEIVVAHMEQTKHCMFSKANQ